MNALVLVSNKLEDRVAISDKLNGKKSKSQNLTCIS